MANLLGTLPSVISIEVIPQYVSPPFQAGGCGFFSVLRLLFYAFLAGHWPLRTAAFRLEFWE